MDFFRGERFSLVSQSLDAAMKISSREGNGLKTRSAGVINEAEEEKLWESVLGNKEPKQLLRTLFCLNGLHFALRGGEEHANLSIEQFSIQDRNGKRCIVYKETVSKTSAGGLRTTRIRPKEVVHFENETNPERCHVRLFEQFLGVRPAGTTRFYLQPAKHPTSVWFTNRPIGKNKLASFLTNMCSEAGLVGKKTNHSLRATCATRLYQAGVEEQQIMERTGHRSVTGVRCYKRTSDVHIEHCSAVLDAKGLTETAQVSTKCNFIFNDCKVVINN